MHFHDVVLLEHCFFFFFFNDTATTEIYTLSLHDALPIFCASPIAALIPLLTLKLAEFSLWFGLKTMWIRLRSEEHTSELQSQSNLVCRLLLEKKKSRRAAHLSPDRSRSIGRRCNVPPAES